MPASIFVKGSGFENMSCQISTALHMPQRCSTKPVEKNASKAHAAEETPEESGDTEQDLDEDSERDTEEEPEAGVRAVSTQKSTNDKIKAFREARAGYLAAGTQQSPNKTAANTKPDKKSHAAKMEPKKVTTTTPCKYCGKPYKYAHSLRKHQEELCAKRPNRPQSRDPARDIASQAPAMQPNRPRACFPAYEQTQQQVHGLQLEAIPATYSPAVLFLNGQVMQLAVLSADLNPMAAFQQASMEDTILQTEHFTLAGRLEAIRRVHEYEHEQRMLKHQLMKIQRVMETAVERELDRTQPTWELLTTCWGPSDGFEP